MVIAICLVSSWLKTEGSKRLLLSTTFVLVNKAGEPSIFCFLFPLAEDGEGCPTLFSFSFFTIFIFFFFLCLYQAHVEEVEYLYDGNSRKIFRRYVR